MTCRVARSYWDPPRKNPVTCSECGSPNLEVFYTLQTFGTHLCPICAQSTVECGVPKEWTPGPVREGVFF
jgi:hypothetical protein